uniref:Transposase n=1 Tax=Bursaphelenchus xylophilus TaxID=6326 RepID=A0A1I7RVR1_BURXY
MRFTFQSPIFLGFHLPARFPQATEKIQNAKLGVDLTSFGHDILDGCVCTERRAACRKSTAKAEPGNHHLGRTARKDNVARGNKNSKNTTSALRR